ncbi:MAG: thioredoxin domain-containing protein [Thermodesulfovibrio sp.]|nr:thioredoxin domain-containing protein [Thermodesulfovibrio sp.]
MSPNRLINEKSPYLRAHASNPVDWYPWCDEAFEKAKRENKPIFLSIGYSSCHWCHVMEKESFEDQEIAEILNRHFIPIKVDREERPDIDSIYMKVCYLFQNRGGWPLTIFMMPDKKPFFADTYIPKEDFYGKIGLKKLLLRVIELWENNKDKIKEASLGITEALKNMINRKSDKKELLEDMIHKAYEELSSIFDEKYKGFGKSPKFPLPLNMLFLHRYFYRYKNQKALDMSLQTLRRMRMGGIYDQIGFGFHRYSTDREWILPHFEKMLYDNALLMIAYTEAYQLSKDDFYRTVTEEIVTYLLRDMYSPEEAFYSAEDADSEGKEGEFYLWKYDEIKNILNEEEFEILRKVYPVSEEGNFYEESTGKKNGKNILYLSNPLEDIAKNLNTEQKEIFEKIENIRIKLFQKRTKRVRPLRDEKILTDWNALAIIAFLKAGTVFENTKYIEVAEKSLKFILSNMFDNSGRLLHRYSEKEASIYAYLEDYAYLIWALMEAYFTTFKGEYLLKSIELTDYTLKHFWDKENGGFYHTPDYAEVIIERIKEIYDGVTPSGNSIMAFNLVRLARLIGEREYEKLANKILQFFSNSIEQFPSSHVFSIISLDLLVNGSIELIAVPFNSIDEEIEFLRNIQKIFIPSLIPLLKDTLTEKFYDKIKDLKTVNGKSTYYLCKNFMCQPPINEREKLIDSILSI